MEDSFGFSWGFPPTESQFPLTGFFPFHKGAAAYRFFLHDAISFEKSLRVTIGFGEHEDPMFRREFSRRGNTLQFSSTVYWYQTEPHAPLPALPLPPTVPRLPSSRSGPTRRWGPQHRAEPWSSAQEQELPVMKSPVGSS